MQNPFKVGDKVRVTTDTAYGSVRKGALGTVETVFSPTAAVYCVWLSFDTGYPAGADWPFALHEIEPYSPAKGSANTKENANG